MIRRQTFVGLIFCLAAAGDLASARQLESNAGNGRFLERFEVSGPLFGLLRRLGSNVGLSETDSKLARQMAEDKKFDKAIFACARSFGFILEWTYCDPNNPSDIVFPCLLLQQESETNKNGYELLLAVKRTEGDDGSIAYDFRNGKGWIVVNDSDLPRQFTGYMIIKKSNKFELFIRCVTAVFVVAACTLAVKRFGWQKFGKNQNLNSSDARLSNHAFGSGTFLTIAGLAVSLSSGCDDNASWQELARISHTPEIVD